MKNPITLKQLKKDRYLILLCLPVIIYYIIFHYVPMYQLIVAFQDYSIRLGVLGSKWVGFQWFEEFFNSYYFFRLLRNTLSISAMQIIFAFPAPIIFALMLNEIPFLRFKKVAQTLSYFPHFVSTVIVVGILVNLTSMDGIFNQIRVAFGASPIAFMLKPKWFLPLYVGSGIWQAFGWNSIIYLASISSISPSLYESASIDGANRFQKLRYITFPSILPTAIILLLLRLGNILTVGFQKIILMYDPAIYGVADVISTYVYRRGLQGGEISFAAAVSLFNSFINFFFIFLFNKLSKKASGVGLW